MPTIVDPDTLPADRFGYRMYGVVAHLSDVQAAAIWEFHHNIGVTDIAARPNFSIHDFYDPDDHGALNKRLVEVARRHGPFMTNVEPDLIWFRGGVALSVHITVELRSLRDDVVASFGDCAKSIHTPETRYWPHTELLTNGSEIEFRRAREHIGSFAIESLLEVESIELVGRVGPDRGGQCRTLQSLPLVG